MRVKRVVQRKRVYTNRRRKVAFRKKRKQTRHLGRELITYMPKGRLIPLPPRYRTRMIAELFGYTGSGAATGDYHWLVNMNSPYLPFNITSGLSGLTANSINITTYQPAGFSQICNQNFYKNYRVYSSSCQVEITPQSVLDSVVCCITPTDNTTYPANVASALTQPFNTEKTFSSAVLHGNTKTNVCKNYLPQHTFIGVSSQAIRDDLSGTYTGVYNNDPSKLLMWCLNIETGDNAVLNSPLEVRIRISYYIEFFNLAYAQVPII